MVYDRIMRQLTTVTLAGFFVALPHLAFGDDDSIGRLLVVPTLQEIRSVLPKTTLLLHDPVAIEKFLEALEGSPPKWVVLHGEDGMRHDEMLFALNRERDRLRAGRAALAQRITFLWDGILSTYLPDKGGFLVAIGPDVISTQWGLVRFKPESLPPELVAVPPTDRTESLHGRLSRGEVIRVLVAMTGRLTPEEALIYDFAHEDRGQGMIMPMVRVERIDYLMTP